MTTKPSALQTTLALGLCGATLAACSSSSTNDFAESDAGATDATTIVDGSTISDAQARESDAGAEAGAPCTTRITYGSSWIHGASHPAAFDDAAGIVTWDGTCTDDGANSYALLSNGFKPYFSGNGACVVALDSSASCVGAAASCTTRVTYGAGWLAPASHPNRYDDLAGRVFGDDTCIDSGGDSYANLSNGYAPHFTGNGACALAYRYSQCGGLYANPVIPVDCPDPGVVYEQGHYVLACTSGNAANAFPIRTSNDLVNWTSAGNIFPSASKPIWANANFWAPEIHPVGSRFVAYFSAQNTDGKLAVGAASAASATGPFTDIGAPLVHDPNMGLIDASEFTDADGSHYLLWKEDGNAVGKPTPIHAQKLATDGLSLTGTPATLITNDQTWEGPLVEGPFMVAHGGMYYLFYSGNGYATAKYAVGVARASSPLGPFVKMTTPILVTGGAWAGPGHCSVVDTPAGDTYIVFHAWEAGAIGAAPGRLVLVDAIEWIAGWPAVPLAPSSNSRPLP